MFVKRLRAILIDRALYKYCIIIIINKQIGCYYIIMLLFLPTYMTQTGPPYFLVLSVYKISGCVKNAHLPHL